MLTLFKHSILKMTSEFLIFYKGELSFIEKANLIVLAIIFLSILVLSSYKIVNAPKSDCKKEKKVKKIVKKVVKRVVKKKVKKDTK
jgi:hypothetical protein